MPEVYSGFRETSDSDDWFTVMRDNARDAMASLRRIRRRTEGSLEVRSRSDDAMVSLYMSRRYRYVPVVTAVLNTEGRRMLGGDVTKEAA